MLHCYDRSQYIQDRIAGRMMQRGEKIILRSVSELSGPEPYRNPPDLSLSDIEIVAGSTNAGRSFISLAGVTVTGRLVPGDKILVGTTTLTVLPMPEDVMTDGDGIPIVDDDLNPVFGTPVLSFTDTLSRNNAFPVVAVSGTTTPATLVAQPAKTSYAADLTCYGYQLSRTKMVAMGWVELDSIGVVLAGKGIPPPQPKVNDQLIFMGGDLRSVMTVGVQSLNGVNFMFQVQAR
jgi:hypothetical protein